MILTKLTSLLVSLSLDLYSVPRAKAVVVQVVKGQVTVPSGYAETLSRAPKLNSDSTVILLDSYEPFFQHLTAVVLTFPWSDALWFLTKKQGQCGLCAALGRTRRKPGGWQARLSGKYIMCPEEQRVRRAGR